MSITDVLWLLPVVAGVVLGRVLRSSGLALLLGLGLVVLSFILFGYSVDHYDNNDCQPGQPCPTGEQVVEIVTPTAFLLGSTLVLVAFGRSVWDYGSELRTRRRRRA